MSARYDPYALLNHKVTGPEGVPESSHLVIITYDSVNSDDGYGGHYENAVAHHHVFSHDEEELWVQCIKEMSVPDESRYQKAKKFVAFVCPGRSTVSVSVNVKVSK